MTSSLQQGITAAKAGNLQQALDYLKDAIIEEPENAEVWVWLAAIIDDDHKQEIFLKKALEISPDNIPAQRGLAYLNKRKADASKVYNDHLSDHTKPITPFPRASRQNTPDLRSEWSKLNVEDIQIPHKEPIKETTGPIEHPQNADQRLKLNFLEISLISVVVIVFFIIGLLAASALFDFDLPLGFLTDSGPNLVAPPPGPGVYLYESAIYFDIQGHQGLPAEDVGIPSSLGNDPLVVFFQMPLETDSIRLIYETGAYIPLRNYQEDDQTFIIKPLQDLPPGLYCLQNLQENQPIEQADYWCFKVAVVEPD